MTCKNVQSFLSAYLDEELSGQEMLDIRAHLGECEDCSEELRTVECVKRMLGDAPVPEPGADFEDRLVASVLGHVEPKSEKLSWLTLAGFAAASMAATFLAIQMFNQRSAKSAEPTDAQAYQFIQRDRALSASNDPLSGSSVSPVTFNLGR